MKRYETELKLALPACGISTHGYADGEIKCTVIWHTREVYEEDLSVSCLVTLKRIDGPHHKPRRTLFSVRAAGDPSNNS